MDLNELKSRRLALAKMMQRNSVAIFSSANKNFRTRDVENPYRQHSDFLYMTGLSEPNLINLVFRHNNEIASVLFRGNTSDHEKIWEGQRLDNLAIKEKYGFSEILDISDYEDQILDYIEQKEIIYIEQGLNSKLDNIILRKLKKSSAADQKKIIPLGSVTEIFLRPISISLFEVLW